MILSDDVIAEIGRVEAAHPVLVDDNAQIRSIEAKNAIIDRAYDIPGALMSKCTGEISHCMRCQFWGGMRSAKLTRHRLSELENA